jgi:hypothetical protein
VRRLRILIIALVIALAVVPVILGLVLLLTS